MLSLVYLCPEDIFGQGRAVYRFKNLEVDNPKIELGDLCFKNFFIFNKYRDVAEKSIREYLEYFATRKPNSPETENIDRLVKWYQTDNETRNRYMTWQQEIDIAVDLERQRANAENVRADDAEKRFFEAKDHADEVERLANAEKARADKAETRADEEKARADRYEKMLRDLGKL